MTRTYVQFRNCYLTCHRNTMWMILLTISQVLNCCLCYNVAQQQSTQRYIQSPVVRARSSTTGPSDLPADVTPSYFGYDFTLSKNRLMIGAPKLSDPNNVTAQPPLGSDASLTAKGDILDCSTTSLFAPNAQSPSCPSKAPADSAPGDSFGQSIALTNNGNLNAPFYRPFFRPLLSILDVNDAQICLTPSNSLRLTLDVSNLGSNFNAALQFVHQKKDNCIELVEVLEPKQGTCSPTKTQSCSGINYTPGFCYRSNNQGRTWNSDPITKSHECKFFLDLMFVLDGSGSVGNDSFRIVKNWTKEVASYFDMSNDFARLGVVQYSHFYTKGDPNRDQPYIKTEVKLGECKTHACFNRKVDPIRLFGFTTHTSSALNKTVEDFRTSDRFNSPSTSKVLILLTDGRSSDSQHLPQSADYVRSLGITTFAVGIGSEIKQSELRTIATGNTKSDERVYNVKNFAGLEEIVSRLKTAILTVTLEGAGSSAVSSYDLELGELGFSMVYRQRNDTVKVGKAYALHCI